MNTQEENYYEELVRLIEKEADEWLEQNDQEFEDIGDPERTFRWEYSHEGLTEKGSRFKHWRAE